MANFQENRAQISEIRHQYHLHAEEQYRLQQALILLDARLENTDASEASLLLESRKTIETTLQQTGQAMAQTRDKLIETMTAFYQTGGPAQLVEALDDQVPVLLLPVKVETRFITVKHIGTELPAAAILDVSRLQPELNQFFEKLLKDGSSRIALPTLQDLRAAGLNSAASTIEREIKRGLLAPANGQWIVKQDDTRELWVRIFPDDIFLHAHESALEEAEYLAGKMYWQERWHAELEFQQNTEEGRDTIRREKISRAWATLVHTFAAPRAKWIISATQPAHFQTGQTDFTTAPEFPPLQQKSAAWTQATRTFVLPDRFVVRLYQGDQIREYSGAIIPPDLALGLDPVSDDFEEDDAHLNLPERLRWLSDFEMAEKAGMALRIPLTHTEYTAGFDRLIVLGVKLSADETQSTALLEDLLYNHQYKSGGLAFLPQGTPTNQTEGIDIAKEQAAQENAAFLQWAGIAPQADTPFGQRSDGTRLSRALGIQPEVLQKVFGNDHHEIDEAAAMNQLLWPATMGYFLQQFLFPLVNSEEQAKTRHFFRDYVAGRGQLPVCRVDDQPYGILPATVFSRWSYRADVSETKFPDRLWQRVLRVLDGQWAQLAQGVSHAGDGFTAANKYSDRLLQLLGLHAGSVEFYVRSLVDPFFSEDVMQVVPDAQLDAPFWEVKKDLEAMNFYFERFETAGRMFDMIFSREVRPLDGPLIDQLPLSEQRKVEALPNQEEHYLTWLFQSELTTALRNETHGMEDAEGLPVLYLLLRHAIVREYMNVAIALLQEAGKLSPVAGVDQEREESRTLGAGHAYYLRTAILMRWQHRVREQVSTAYQELVAGGLTSQRIAEFERNLGQAFPFYSSSSFLQKTVNQAVRKLRARLIPQPDMATVRAAISEFVVDVEEAIDVQVTQEFDGLSGEILIEPDKWKLLTEVYPEVSGSQSMLAFIDNQLQKKDPPEVFKDLVEMKAALAMIRHLPTAKLERLLVEHLDLCNYRLDAWMLGLVQQRLAAQREKTKGLYLGAYGYLEDLRPGNLPGMWVESTTVKLSKETQRLPNLKQLVIPVMHFVLLEKMGLSINSFLKKAYLYLGEDTATRIVQDQHSEQLIVPPPLDTEGEGFIHTPSLAHANTAAILRSGYATYRRPGVAPALTDPFSINLTSHRVRAALHHLEGIRNGQPLGALLGYQLERALYEYADQTPANVGFVSKVPGYIRELRQHFPLQTLESTTDSSVFTVIDGLGLLEAFRQAGGFGHWSANILTNCPAAHRQLLDGEIARLEESLDGLSDLLMAEGVFQMAKGNPERSAAALKVLNEGGMMENPEIIETPRNGFSFLHRVGILSGTSGPVNNWSDRPSALATLQPALNHWVARQLPPPDQCGGSALLPNGERIAWSLAQLNIQALDLVQTLTQSDPEARESALSIRVREQLRSQTGLEAGQNIQVDYQQTELLCTLPEILPLLQSIAGLIKAARPLLPEDLFQPSHRQDGQAAAAIELTGAQAGMESLLFGMEPFSVPALIAGLQTAISADNPATTDELVATCFDTLLEIATYGITAALPQVDKVASAENLSVLKLQGQQVLMLLQRKLNTALGSWNKLPSAGTPAATLELLNEIGQELFGRSFRLFPTFRFHDPGLLQSRSTLLDKNDMEPAEWLLGAALVRSKLAIYQDVCLFREAFAVSDQDQMLNIFQLPESAAPWIAQQLPAENLPNGNTLSLALEISAGFNPQEAGWGMVIDEWHELIPSATTTTGVTFHYNQPEAEAPQVLLLAVTPEQSGQWKWDDLMDTVKESMQLAKKRAVEPDQLKHTSLAHFLPAVIGPINEEGLYPAVDFAKNIKIVVSQ